MKRQIRVGLVVFSSFGSCLGHGQQVIEKSTAQFPGSVLRWIHIAEREFTKQHLDEGKYMVKVWEEQDSVVVLLQNPRRENVRTKGNPGPLPEYEVEIDRHTGRVIHANYER
jgi:hypothetical protein